MRNLQYSIIHFGIVGRQSRNKVLQIWSACEYSSFSWVFLFPDPYLNQGIPFLMEITLRDDTDSFSQLNLKVPRHGDHKADDFVLNGRHVGGRQLVIAFIILISARNQQSAPGYTIRLYIQSTFC